MFRNRAARPGLWALAGLLIALLAALWLPGGLELTVSPVKGGGPLLVLPLRPGERFTLHYVHSVDRAPIWEEHSVDEQGRLYIEEERFVMVGAGMGDLPGRGQWSGRDGLQMIKNMHDPVGDFVLRVGSPGVDHTVLWRGTATNLTRMAAGRAVRFQARPVSLLYRVWRMINPHPRTPA